MRPVRPRPAASLILLRRAAVGIEALLGRRSDTARFMPGRYVFPGGAVHRSDATAWPGEAPEAAGARRRRIAARAALRETFEETGYLIGRPSRPVATSAVGLGLTAADAHGETGIVPPFDALTEIGRAITPTFSPIRFDARFFVADGVLAHGPFHAGDELDAVGWYRVDGTLPEPISGVTRFMLGHALAVWQGGAPAMPIPLYRHIGKAAKIDWRADRRDRSTA